MIWQTEEQQEGLRLSFKIKKKIISKKSKFQKIDIVETYTHGKLMSLDGKIMLTERDEFVYHEMLAHVPLFSSSKVRKVLIIGGGDGGTARECLKHDNLKILHLCEIDEEVISISKKYLPITASCFSNKKLKVFIEDGFKFLKKINKNERYDIILVDSTDPVGAAAILFEDSFFELVKNALNPNGILCTQCESPFFFSETITNVHSILSKMFKNCSHFTAPVTTYPSGYWSFAIASNKKIKFNSKNYQKISKKMNCKFYNDEIHQACFALPNFFKKLINK